MANKIIEKILLHSKETKSFIGIRKDNESSNLWIGYILDFNDNIFVLQHISPLGFKDGFIIEKIDDVDNFEINEDSVKAIETIYQHNSKLLIQNIVTFDISNEENWQYELLQNSFDQGKIITIELNNSDSINYGFVIDFDETTLQIIAIDNVGGDDGTQTYKLADITSLSVDRIEARKREILFELKHTNHNKK